MLDIDRFVEECKSAIAADGHAKALREVVARAVSDPAAVIAALGEPTRAGVKSIYHSPSLTIINLMWGPGMTIMPHNHHMAAIIGLYTGREDNIFWRRVGAGQGAQLEAAGAHSLGAGQCVPLGRDIIHSVTNPLGKITGAIHVYEGDFFAMERSEWEPETLTERRYDKVRNMALFEESNARLAAA